MWRRAVSRMQGTVATAAHTGLTCHNPSLTPGARLPARGDAVKRSHPAVIAMPNSRADKTFVPLSADRGANPLGLLQTEPRLPPVYLLTAQDSQFVAAPALTSALPLPDRV